MDNILKKLIEYFDLGINTKIIEAKERGPIITKPISKRSTKDILWWIGLFIATTFGVFSKYLFDDFSKSNSSLPNNFYRQKLILSIIISIVIYPSIYKNSSFDPKKPNIIHLFMSFQNGFFWHTIIGEIKSG